MVPEEDRKVFFKSLWLVWMCWTGTCWSVWVTVKRRDQALCRNKKKGKSLEVMNVFCRSNISALNKRVKDTTARARTHSPPLTHAGMSTRTLRYSVSALTVNMHNLINISAQLLWLSSPPSGFYRLSLALIPPTWLLLTAFTPALVAASSQEPDA